MLSTQRSLLFLQPSPLECRTEGGVQGFLPVIAGLDDGKFGENSCREIGGGIGSVGTEIFATADGRADDLVRAAAQSDQGGMDPTRTEEGAEDVPGGADREMLYIAAEVDFPTVRAENARLCLPLIGQPGEEPETDGLMSVLGIGYQPEPGIGEAAKLPKGGDDNGPIPPRSFLRPVFGRHFGEDKAGQGFADGEREQAHGRRLAG